MNDPEVARERLAARLSQVGGRLKVPNAMHSSLWLCGIVAGPCFAIIAFSDHPPLVVQVVLCVVVGLPVFAFLFLLLFDRNRLHSEHYLIRKQTLDLIEEKGGERAVTAATIKAISSEDFLRLGDDEGSK